MTGETVRNPVLFSQDITPVNGIADVDISSNLGGKKAKGVICSISSNMVTTLMIRSAMIRSENLVRIVFNSQTNAEIGVLFTVFV